MNFSNIGDCKIVELPKINNLAGNITVVENMKNIPFEVKRVYYLYDLPGGSERGGHAHKKLQQFIIAISGSFDVLVNDGENEKIVHLDRPYFGLHLRNGIWRELVNFSSGSVCLVLASEKYDESDYIRTYDEYLKVKK